MRQLFLPGAGGSAGFWKPLAERLPGGAERRFFAWPGLGDEPPDPAVRGIDDLVAMVTDALDDAPADLIAQSMGGVVAVRAALARPGRVRRLVLAATSGGVPVADLGGADWRGDYRAAYPAAAAWIAAPQPDFSARLGELALPCLLLWGDADAISPPAVGRRLLELLPDARLHVVAGGAHDLAVVHAEALAPLVAEFLG